MGAFNLNNIKRKDVKQAPKQAQERPKPSPQSKKYPNLKTRPKLEDQTFLSDEMERFAAEIRSGFTPEEAAERMGIPIDKAIKFAMNKSLQNRVKMLLGDKLGYWANLRDELYETCLKTSQKLVKQGKIPWQNLQWFIDRLEKQNLIDEPSKKKTIMAKEEKYLENPNEVELYLEGIMDKDKSDGKPPKRKLLSKRTIEMKEEEKPIPEPTDENAEDISNDLEKDALKEINSESSKSRKGRKQKSNDKED